MSTNRQFFQCAKLLIDKYGEETRLPQYGLHVSPDSPPEVTADSIVISRYNRAAIEKLDETSHERQRNIKR